MRLLPSRSLALAALLLVPGLARATPASQAESAQTRQLRSAVQELKAVNRSLQSAVDRGGQLGRAEVVWNPFVRGLHRVSLWSLIGAGLTLDRAARRIAELDKGVKQAESGLWAELTAEAQKLSTAYHKAENVLYVHERPLLIFKDRRSEYYGIPGTLQNAWSTFLKAEQAQGLNRATK